MHYYIIRSELAKIYSTDETDKIMKLITDLNKKVFERNAKIVISEFVDYKKVYHFIKTLEFDDQLLLCKSLIDVCKITNAEAKIQQIYNKLNIAVSKKVLTLKNSILNSIEIEKTFVQEPKNWNEIIQNNLHHILLPFRNHHHLHRNYYHYTTLILFLLFLLLNAI